MHGASTNKKTREDSRKVLDWIYGRIPETKGCMENNSKSESEGGCGSWCCSSQNPQVLYVEFLNAWHHVTHTWKQREFLDLVERCLRAYLYDGHRRGCVFWNRETKLCNNHEKRPFNCRVYGITPKEEFGSRFARLKVIYPDMRDQCSLVSTVNGKTVTTKETDEWWKLINNAEKALGVNPKKIHDGVDGSYRTYYEHVLLETMGVEGMQMLSDTRLAGSPEEKEAILQKALAGLKDILDAAVQSKSSNS